MKIQAFLFNVRNICPTKDIRNLEYKNLVSVENKINDRKII